MIGVKEIKRDLGHLICQFGNIGCTDARDRMFALLSIAEKEAATWLPMNTKLAALQSLAFHMNGRFFGYYSNHDIVADYTLSLFELYLWAMRKCGQANAEFVSSMLRIPGDLVIPFNTSGCEPEKQNSFLQRKGSIGHAP